MSNNASPSTSPVPDSAVPSPITRMKSSSRLKKRLSFWKSKNDIPAQLEIVRQDDAQDSYTKSRESLLVRGRINFDNELGTAQISGRKARPGNASGSAPDPKTMTLPGHMHGGQGHNDLQRGRNTMASSVPRLNLPSGEGTRQAEALALSPRNYRVGRSQTAPSSPRDAPQRKLSARQPVGGAATPPHLAAAAAAALADNVPLFQVRVLHAFEAQDKNEVSVQPGDVCDVMFDVMREQGWFEVVTARGTHGLIPVGFCEVIASSVRDAHTYNDVDFDVDGESQTDDTAYDSDDVARYLNGTRDSQTVVAPSYGDMYDDDAPPSLQAPRPAHTPRSQLASASTTAASADTPDAPDTPAELTPRSALDRQRSHVVREILETEQIYVNDLAFVCEHFLEPIRKKKLLKPADVEAIFRNIESLYELHKDILVTMEDAVQNGMNEGGKFPAANTKLADVFLNKSDYLKLYTMYCVHQESSRNLLLARLKSSSNFASYAREAQRHERARNLDLEAFLIKPVQRICKYPLLMRELLKMTDEAHPDYDALKRAHGVLENIAEHVNEQKCVAFSIRRMAHIDKNLSGWPSKFQLALPTRRFVMEGDLLRIGNGQRALRHVFLFNDILVYAKSKGKDKYQFRGMLVLNKETTFVELVSKLIEPNAFQIIKAECKTSNIFAATSHPLRLQWLNALSRILGKENVRSTEKRQISARRASEMPPSSPPLAEPSTPTKLGSSQQLPSRGSSAASSTSSLNGSVSGASALRTSAGQQADATPRTSSGPASSPSSRSNSASSLTHSTAAARPAKPSALPRAASAASPIRRTKKSSSTAAGVASSAGGSFIQSIATSPQATPVEHLAQSPTSVAASPHHNGALLSPLPPDLQIGDDDDDDDDEDDANDDNQPPPPPPEQPVPDEGDMALNLLSELASM